MHSDETIFDSVRKLDNKQGERFNGSLYLTKKIPAQQSEGFSIHVVKLVWLIALKC